VRAKPALCGSPLAALRLACVFAAGVAVASLAAGIGQAGPPLRWAAVCGLVAGAGLAGLAIRYRAALFGRPVPAGNSDNLQFAVLALWAAVPAWGLWQAWALPHRVPELLDVALVTGAVAALSFPLVLVWGGPGRARGAAAWGAAAALPMAAGWLASRYWQPESEGPGLALVAGLALGAALQALLLLAHQDGLRPVGVFLLGPILALTVAGEVYTKHFVGPVMLVGGYYPYYVWMQPDCVDDPVDLQHVRPFRGRLPGPRRSDVFRVVVLGASVTYGLGLPADSAEDYPSLMAPMLSECAGGRPVECLNAGVPGFTSELGLELLRRRLVGLLPDLVIVCFGTNDQADDNAGPGLDRRLLAQESKLAASPGLLALRSLARRSGLYLLLARAAVTGQVADVVDLRYGQPFGFGELSLPRVTRTEFLENLESFVALSKRQGFRLAITSDVYAEDLGKPCGTPGSENWAGGWVPLGRNLARERGVMWLEARNAFCDPAIPTEQLFFDGVHLTVLGHRMLARELTRQLCAAGLFGAAAQAVPGP
jgi:lysophospholipase L1-like esterase